MCRELDALHPGGEIHAPVASVEPAHREVESLLRVAVDVPGQELSLPGGGLGQVPRHGEVGEDELDRPEEEGRERGRLGGL